MSLISLVFCWKKEKSEKKRRPPLEGFLECGILLHILSETNVSLRGSQAPRGWRIFDKIKNNLVSDILKDYNFLREREDEHKTLHFVAFDFKH